MFAVCCCCAPWSTCPCVHSMRGSWLSILRVCLECTCMGSCDGAGTCRQCGLGADSCRVGGGALHLPGCALNITCGVPQRDLQLAPEPGALAARCTCVCGAHCSPMSNQQVNQPRLSAYSGHCRISHTFSGARGDKLPTCIAVPPGVYHLCSFYPSWSEGQI